MIQQDMSNRIQIKIKKAYRFTNKVLKKRKEYPTGANLGSKRKAADCLKARTGGTIGHEQKRI